MTQPTIPSKDPADDGTLGGGLKTVLRKHQMAHQGQLPCIVISYSRITNKAVVRPLISVLSTSGKVVPRATIASVPVLALGGGGFTMTFPLKAGDLGWIEASDRDISLFIQTMQSTRPNTFRLHSFEDGRFIPDAFAQYTFDSPADAMVIQSFDGTTQISLSPSAGILLQSPIAVTLKVGANTFAMTAAGTDSNVPMTMPEAVINGISHSTHQHGNVLNGGDLTDGPQA